MPSPSSSDFLPIYLSVQKYTEWESKAVKIIVPPWTAGIYRAGSISGPGVHRAQRERSEWELSVLILSAVHT
jgi:hypothetical protein